MPSLCRLVLPACFFWSSLRAAPLWRASDEGLIDMKKLLQALALVAAVLFASVRAQTQEPPVTLILQSGEEIRCRVMDIWKGEIIFEATSAEVVYRYGDRVSLDNVARVKLKDGQTLSPGEFIDYRAGRRRPSEAVTEAASPAKVEAQPGLRLSPNLQQTTGEKTAARVGLRWREIPYAEARQVSFDIIQVADMLAEAGLAGRLLYESHRGRMSSRKLTDSQHRVLDALEQSVVWQRRRADLREANQQSFAAFAATYEQQPHILRELLGFMAQQPATAFLEFIQYLHVTARANVESEWQEVEQLLGRRAAAAVLDLLNNYDDWYYLFGAELERR